MRDTLANLASEGNLRSLVDVRAEGKFLHCQGKKYLNLSSNDYLGLSDSLMQAAFLCEINLPEANLAGRFLMSNPSSRLMTGNSLEYAKLENSLETLFGRKALALGSGYLTNIGVLPAVTRKGDLVLADKLVHASIIDGLRLCECEWTRFRHNDLEHLRQLLAKSQGKYSQIFVVTESIFSMDGDIAPLTELVALKREYGFKLYVDEAHAFGVFGEKGLGVAETLSLINEIDYIIATFGKALASQGAFVICGELEKRFLINKMRSLIFSTALPPISLLWSNFLLQRLPELKEQRTHLRQLSLQLKETLNDKLSASQIIPFIVGDNKKTLALADKLKEDGYWITPIRYPTVPKGTARLRISLSAALTATDLSTLAERLKHHAYRMDS